MLGTGLDWAAGEHTWRLQQRRCVSGGLLKGVGNLVVAVCNASLQSPPATSGSEAGREAGAPRDSLAFAQAHLCRQRLPTALLLHRSAPQSCWLRPGQNWLCGSLREPIEPLAAQHRPGEELLRGCVKNHGRY